jgi:hypothetical protein
VRAARSALAVRAPVFAFGVAAGDDPQDGLDALFDLADEVGDVVDRAERIGVVEEAAVPLERAAAQSERGVDEVAGLVRLVVPRVVVVADPAHHVGRVVERREEPGGLPVAGVVGGDRPLAQVLAGGVEDRRRRRGHRSALRT